MRILHLAKFYPPMRGGIERFTSDLAAGCVRAGDAVEVLSFGRRVRTVSETRDGVRVFRAASLGTLRSQPLSPRYLSLGRSLQADLLHLHEPNPAGEWVARMRRDIPLVVTYHSEVIRQRLLGAALGPLRRAGLEQAFRIAVPTPRHLEAMPSLAPFRDRISVIPFGVDAARFRDGLPLPEHLAAPKRHGPTALFVGRLVPYKGLGVLLDALAGMTGPEGLPLRLMVVGEGPEGASLRRRAGDLGLGDRVHWAGPVTEEDLPHYHRMADLFVLPSLDRSEMFGYAMLEAMASARPVVCTDLPGPSWLNRHGETGLVVPAGDAGALREALRTLVSDPAMARRMGEAGRRRARADFSLDAMVDAYRGLYGKALSAAR